jgi:sulfatase modifying factor 1
MLVLACTLLLQAAPREEVVDLPAEKLKIPLVHVPVEGTSLRPYALAKHETTWKAFLAFYREDEPKRVIDGLTRPSTGRSFFGQVQCPEALLEDKKPAINLRWHGAMAFCDWLTATTGRKFRLPTEPEWEHAARAGDQGAAPADPKAVAWFAGNAGEGTHPPGASRPNAWGLHDLLGNAWEVMLEPADPPAFGPVWRGGSWKTPEAELTYGARQRLRTEWFGSDPNNPRSMWWLTNEFSQGMRPAAVGGPAELKASAAYAPKIKVVLSLPATEKSVPLSKEEKGKVLSAVPDFYATVKGEVTNTGDRDVEELELFVHYLTPKGEPHLMEKDGAAQPNRPNFTWTWPVLASSAHAGARPPLPPGATRAFQVDVPKSWDSERYVDPKGFGARVAWVRLKP